MLHQETTDLIRYCTAPFSNVEGQIQDAQGFCSIKGDTFGPYQTRWIPSVSNELVAAGAVVLILWLGSWGIKGASADQGQLFNIGGGKYKVKKKAGDSGYTVKFAV
jgi:hypothetical protein